MTSLNFTQNTETYVRTSPEKEHVCHSPEGEEAVTEMTHTQKAGATDLRQTINEAVDVGVACSLDNLSHGHLSAVVAVRNVVADAAVKQDGLL